MDIDVKHPQKKNKEKGLLHDSDLSEAVRKLWNESVLPQAFIWPSAIDFPSFGSNLYGKGVKWLPKADYSETDKEVRLKVDLPNVDPEKISVEVDDHSLEISGSTEKEEEEQGETWYRAERSFGEFKRVFELPHNLDLERISANAKNGTVYVSIPKLSISEKKKVHIDKK